MKMAMVDMSRGAFEHKEARLVAIRSGMLRDQFDGKIEIEIAGAHRVKDSVEA